MRSTRCSLASDVALPASVRFSRTRRASSGRSGSSSIRATDAASHDSVFVKATAPVSASLRARVTLGSSTPCCLSHGFSVWGVAASGRSPSVIAKAWLASRALRLSATVAILRANGWSR